MLLGGHPPLNLAFTLACAAPLSRRATPAPDPKLKLEAVLGDDEVLHYRLPTGWGVSTGQAAVSRLGPTTLVGTTFGTAGGTASVYHTTAWPGPLENGEQVPNSAAVRLRMLPYLNAFFRFIVNRAAGCSLGAAAVCHTNLQDSPLLVHGAEHNATQLQAYTAYNAGAASGFDTAWHSAEEQDAFIAVGAAAKVPHVLFLSLYLFLLKSLPAWWRSVLCCGAGGTAASR